jgi:polysaccharide biosynthesis protein PslH
MRLLYIMPAFPAPVSGGRTRVYYLMKELAKRHEVSAITFVQPVDEAHRAEVEQFCWQLVGVEWSGFEPLSPWRNRTLGWLRILFKRRPAYVDTFPLEKMRIPLKQLMHANTFDVVVFEQLFLVELLDEVKGTPAILVEQNVESEITRRALVRAANPVHRLRDWLTWRKLAAYERQWVRRFPVCVAVSDEDAAQLKKMAPESDIHVVPNGVDTNHFAPDQTRRGSDTVLFFGSLNYGPNVDGLTWFCQEVWWRIRQAYPEVTLEIVGLNPGRNVEKLAKLPACGWSDSCRTFGRSCGRRRYAWCPFILAVAPG